MSKGNSNSDSNMTVKEAAIYFDKSLDAIKMKLKRHHNMEKSFSAKEVLQNDDLEMLTKFYQNAELKKPTTIQETIKEKTLKKKQKNVLQGFSISTMTELDIINFIEMGLIMFGLYQLFYIPGIMLSLMVCLYIFKAQSIAKNSKFKKTITKSLEVVFWIATASFFLHFVTFYRNIPEFDLVTNSTNEFITIGVPLLIAFLPALFTSILNYMSISTTASISKKE